MVKRSRSTGFEAWLNAALAPVYVLDKKRQVTIFSNGCAELTGWPAAEVVGGLCDYASPPDGAIMENLLAVLCPPPSVYEGEHVQVAAFVPHKDGTAISRMMHHFPMANRDGVIDRVITFIRPLENPAVQGSSPAQRLHAELASLRFSLRQQYGFSSVIAVANSMLRVLKQVRLATSTIASVHFTGEPGSGREHLARVSHNESDLSSTSFVPLDCQKLSADELAAALQRMLDTQSGETTSLPHLLTGTLFLRAVEFLPRDIQRLLVDRWAPSESEMPSRLVTSSCLSVSQLSENEDLLPEFVRLCGTLEILLPPLRKRMDDLPPLAQYFLEQQNQGQQRQLEGFADSTLAELKKYHWPGNTTELRHVVIQALDQCDGIIVEPQHLPMRFRSGMDARRTSPTPKLSQMELEPLLMQVETEHIQRALDASGGNRSEAARLLGITRPKLYRRMEQLGMNQLSSESKL
jgi:DNA-binding NtrC family response regulator